MFTLGIDLDISRYCDFIRGNYDVLEMASSVDVIGRGQEQTSYDNFKRIEAERLPIPVYPVHHARDDDSWLKKYIDEGYDYILLGGMVPESPRFLVDWLDRIWDKYLANADGTARIRVHAFGVTNFDLMKMYPWHSVDSTSWIYYSMYGVILYENEHGKLYRMKISRNAAGNKVADGSFWSLDTQTKASVGRVIRSKGFDPDRLADSKGERDRWNIRFYREHMLGIKPRLTRRSVFVL